MIAMTNLLLQDDHDRTARIDHSRHNSQERMTGHYRTARTGERCQEYEDRVTIVGGHTVVGQLERDSKN